MSATAETGVSGHEQGDAFARLKARLQERGFEPAAPEPAPEPYMRHFDFDRERDADGRPRYLRPTDCEGQLCIVDRDGPVWLLRCDSCGWEAGIPLKRVDPAAALERQLQRCGIPDKFRGERFDTQDTSQQEAVKPCRAWLRDFNAADLVASIPTPALHGPPGRGKTHLLSMLIEVLIKRHKIDALYRSSSQLFDELQAGMDTDAYEVRWQRVLEVPVLALDDLGAGRMTDWRRDRLFALVDHRMNRGLPLLIATNHAPDVWAEVFGDRAASRMRGLVVPFLLQGPDRRAQTTIPF
jgi:DNA replication protein DnaC